MKNRSEATRQEAGGRVERRGEGARGLWPLWLMRTIGYAVAFLVLAATAWVLVQAAFAVPLLLFTAVAALLVTALLAPLVDRTTGVLRWRWLAALVLELLFLAALAGSVVFVGTRAMGQLTGLTAAVDRALADLQRWATSPPLSLSPERFSEIRSNAVRSLEAAVPSPSAGATMVLELLSGFAIAIFVVFFLLKDGAAIWRWVLAWAPARRARLVDDLGKHAWGTLARYVRGMVVVALFDAVLIGLALFFLGVPLVLSLTLVIFIGAFVPIVGATVSGALAVAVTMVSAGTWQALVVLGVVLLVQQLEGNVLQPIVMGRAVDLHPIVIVLAVTAGGLLAGIGGAVMAVPLVAVTYRVLDRLIGPSAITGARQDTLPSTGNAGASTEA